MQSIIPIILAYPTSPITGVSTGFGSNITNLLYGAAIIAIIVVIFFVDDRTGGNLLINRIWPPMVKEDTAGGKTYDRPVEYPTETMKTSRGTFLIKNPSAWRSTGKETFEVNLEGTTAEPINDIHQITIDYDKFISDYIIGHRAVPLVIGQNPLFEKYTKIRDELDGYKIEVVALRQELEKKRGSFLKQVGVMFREQAELVKDLRTGRKGTSTIISDKYNAQSGTAGMEEPDEGSSSGPGE